MKHIRWLLSVSGIALSLVSSSVFAAAFQLYELGTPIIGTAAVGQAAVANDASTSYFNPAGMTQLKTTQYMLGSQVILPHTSFSKNTNNTISGDNGGNAAMLTPGMSMFYVYHYSPKLQLGVSFTSPYGGVLSYTNGWVGRYLVQNTTMYALNLNPVISYQMNRWLAVGVGASVEYANLSQTVALRLGSDLIDGQVSVKVSNFAPGFNAGVLFTPGENTKLGVAYRSRILHNLTGNTTFLRISDEPISSTKLIMPQNVIVSLDQSVTNRFNLLGELGWANWSSMRSNVLKIAGYSVTTDLNWNDTYRVGLGGQFKATPVLLIQAGVSLDSSPTTATRRTPNLPMDRQVRVGTGLTYAVIKPVKLGFSYEYINFGKADISHVSTAGVFAGQYSRNYANVLQASINVEC